ncbi:Esterase CG5412 [Linum perenne]
MGSEGEIGRKPRFLCLHGFRTSAEILKKQLNTKWPESVLEKLDLVYVDAPHPAEGKSEEFTEYRNFDECLAFIEELMIKHSPIDGLLGFSQGAILSAGLPGLQDKGLALTRVPKIKFLIIIGGAKFKAQSVAENSYASPIECPSLHFLGELDFLKPYGKELLESCADAVVVHHPKGHTIPRLDEKGLATVTSFIGRIQNLVSVEGNDTK